jgi:uncharacterized membrane protein (DUF485 family)
VLTAPPAREEVLAAASLFVWTLTLIVLVKYVGVVLRFDDNGEGEGFRRGVGWGWQVGVGAHAQSCGLMTTGRMRGPLGRGVGWGSIEWR